MDPAVRQSHTTTSNDGDDKRNVDTSKLVGGSTMRNV